MVLDNKIKILKQKFQIRTVRDWERISPTDVLSTPDIGEVTLNHIRLHLASHGITLKDDQTPKFWQSHLYQTKLGTLQVSDEDRSVVNPFTIAVDVQEKHPWHFQGICDSDQRPIIIPVESTALGVSHGDYSIVGFEGECHIERKSPEDAIGTILGWGDRRERFERTLEFLSSVWTAAVIIECSLGYLIHRVDCYGKKSKEENRKILHRQILAWQVDYTVPWIFCDDRRLAEVSAFRLMDRCYRKKVSQQKSLERNVSNAIA